MADESVAQLGFDSTDVVKGIEEIISKIKGLRQAMSATFNLKMDESGAKGVKTVFQQMTAGILGLQKSIDTFASNTSVALEHIVTNTEGLASALLRQGAAIGAVGKATDVVAKKEEEASKQERKHTADQIALLKQKAAARMAELKALERRLPEDKRASVPSLPSDEWAAGLIETKKNNDVALNNETYRLYRDAFKSLLKETVAAADAMGREAKIIVTSQNILSDINRQIAQLPAHLRAEAMKKISDLKVDLTKPESILASTGEGGTFVDPRMVSEARNALKGITAQAKKEEQAIEKAVAIEEDWNQRLEKLKSDKYATLRDFVKSGSVLTNQNDIDQKFVDAVQARLRQAEEGAKIEEAANKTKARHLQEINDALVVIKRRYDRTAKAAGDVNEKAGPDGQVRVMSADVVKSAEQYLIQVGSEWRRDKDAFARLREDIAEWTAEVKKAASTFNSLNAQTDKSTHALNAWMIKQQSKLNQIAERGGSYAGPIVTNDNLASYIGKNGKVNAVEFQKVVQGIRDATRQATQAEVAFAKAQKGAKDDAKELLKTHKNIGTELVETGARMGKWLIFYRLVRDTMMVIETSVSRFVSLGTEYTRSLELQQLGVNATLAEHYKLIDAQGQEINGAAKIALMHETAVSQWKQLQVASLAVVGQTQDMMMLYSAILPHAESLGASLDDVQEMTRATAVAASLMDVSFNDARSAIVSLLQGRYLGRNRLTTILGLSKDEIESLRGTPELFQRIMAQLRPFDSVAGKAAETLGAMTETAQEFIGIVSREVQSPFLEMFKGLVTEAQDTLFDKSTLKMKDSVSGLLSIVKASMEEVVKELKIFGQTFSTEASEHILTWTAGVRDALLAVAKLATLFVGAATSLAAFIANNRTLIQSVGAVVAALGAFTIVDNIGIKFLKLGEATGWLATRIQMLFLRMGVLERVLPAVSQGLLASAGAANAAGTATGRAAMEMQILANSGKVAKGVMTTLFTGLGAGALLLGLTWLVSKITELIDRVREAKNFADRLSQGDYPGATTELRRKLESDNPEDRKEALGLEMQAINNAATLSWQSMKGINGEILEMGNGGERAADVFADYGMQLRTVEKQAEAVNLQVAKVRKEFLLAAKDGKGRSIASTMGLSPPQRKELGDLTRPFEEELGKLNTQVEKVKDKRDEIRAKLETDVSRYGLLRALIAKEQTLAQNLVAAQEAKIDAAAGVEWQENILKKELVKLQQSARYWTTYHAITEKKYLASKKLQSEMDKIPFDVVPNPNIPEPPEIVVPTEQPMFRTHLDRQIENDRRMVERIIEGGELEAQLSGDPEKIRKASEEKQQLLLDLARDEARLREQIYDQFKADWEKKKAISLLPASDGKIHPLNDEAWETELQKRSGDLEDAGHKQRVAIARAKLEAKMSIQKAEQWVAEATTATTGLIENYFGSSVEKIEQKFAVVMNDISQKIDAADREGLQAQSDKLKAQQARLWRDLPTVVFGEQLNQDVKKNSDNLEDNAKAQERLNQMRQAGAITVTSYANQMNALKRDQAELLSVQIASIEKALAYERAIKLVNGATNDAKIREYTAQLQDLKDQLVTLNNTIERFAQALAAFEALGTTVADMVGQFSFLNEGVGLATGALQKFFKQAGMISGVSEAFKLFQTQWKLLGEGGGSGITKALSMFSGGLGTTDMTDSAGKVVGKQSSNISAALGAVGIAAGLALSITSALFDRAVKKAKENITKGVTAITDGLADGAKGLGDSLAAMEAYREDAVRKYSSSKSGRKALEEILPQIDDQIKSWAKQIDDAKKAFQEKLDQLRLPESPFGEMAKLLMDISKESADYLALFEKGTKNYEDALASIYEFYQLTIDRFRSQLQTNMQGFTMEAIGSIESYLSLLETQKNLYKNLKDLSKERRDIEEQAQQLIEDGVSIQEEYADLEKARVEKAQQEADLRKQIRDVMRQAAEEEADIRRQGVVEAQLTVAEKKAKQIQEARSKALEEKKRLEKEIADLQGNTDLDKRAKEITKREEDLAKRIQDLDERRVEAAEREAEIQKEIELNEIRVRTAETIARMQADFFGLTYDQMSLEELKGQIQIEQAKQQIKTWQETKALIDAINSGAKDLFVPPPGFPQIRVVIGDIIIDNRDQSKTQVNVRRTGEGNGGPSGSPGNNNRNDPTEGWRRRGYGD